MEGDDVMEKIIATTMAALVAAVIWYLKYQTKAQREQQVKHDEQQLKREEKHDKQQDEYRKFHRDLITNHLKDLQDSSTENSKLNSQSLLLQKEMIKDLQEHNGYCKEASKKIIASFSAVIERLITKHGIFALVRKYANRMSHPEFPTKSFTVITKE
ncbi:hypothetical protein ES708_29027 [subsurface metagenome]